MRTQIVKHRLPNSKLLSVLALGADPVVRRTIIAELRRSGSVFAEDEADLLISQSPSAEALQSALEQRVLGVPLEYILGWASFYGIKVAVGPGVFIPRHRTEFLVQEALSRLGAGDIVVDLCCGSGAVARAIVEFVRVGELHAVDLDPKAVECANQNLRSFGQVYCGSLYEPLPDHLLGRVQMLIANAPYVPTSEIELMPQESRLYEPRLALDGGVDGLRVQREVAEGALLWILDGGYLLIETSRVQANRTANILRQVGLIPQIARSEDGEATVVIGKKGP